jgi:hypothetical protein
MATFLTVKEASQRTGKSPSSIRRIIYPMIKNDAHPDRNQIQPSIDEAMALRMKGENFAWRLSEELLLREMPPETESANASPAASAKSAAHADAELLAMLRGELEIKNRQIGQQSELISKQLDLISGLSERVREGNVLIGSLQQHLALTDGRAGNQPITAKTKRASSTEPEKGSTIASKTAKPKKSFFARIFS